MKTILGALLKLGLLTCVAAGGLAVSAASASAQPFSLRAGEKAVIGMVGNEAYIRFRKGTGACSWKRIGVGGLNGDVVINGTSGADEVYLPTQTQDRVCDFVITPLVYNGHRLTINTAGGNDNIGGGGNGNTLVTIGGPGDDLVQNFSGWETWGGTGNDTLYGTWNDWLQGEDGNDWLVITPGATADTANGGFGNDIICGGTATTITGIEARCI